MAPKRRTPAGLVVPADAAPGVYRGALTATLVDGASGAKVVTTTGIELRVWPIACVLSPPQYRRVLEYSSRYGIR